MNHMVPTNRLRNSPGNHIQPVKPRQMNTTGNNYKTGIIQRFESCSSVESVPNHEQHLSWEHILLKYSSLNHERHPVTNYKGPEYAKIN